MNSYCLPKIWFRAHCVDLRQTDVTKIHGNIKSWVYGDQFFKPEERILFRPSSFGGLGVHHVKLKAQAALIRSFLETACHPQFIPSLYHSTLFRYHVVGETGIPDPGFPPFYPKDFFSKIREVYLKPSFNVTTMSQKQWYNLLLENCTMELGDGDEMTYIPSRVEVASPLTDWKKTWRLARMQGLGSEHTSFLFRLLHQLLPTQERLHRANKVVNAFCKAPGCSGTEVDTLAHNLVECQANLEVGENLMNVVRQYQPNLSLDAALRLEVDVDDELELPLVWLCAATLLSIWDQRNANLRVQPYLTRAELEAKVNLLRETRMSSNVNVLKQLITSMFEN